MRSRVGGLAVALAAALVVAAPAGAATAGELDPSFGTGGVTLNPVGGGLGAAAVARQGDGKLVVAGTGGASTSFVVRYDTGGQPDTTFAPDGFVALNPPSGTTFSAEAVALDGGGGILVAGTLGTNDGDEFGLVRLDSSGGVDTTFGTDGWVQTPVGDASPKQADADALVVEPTSGNIYVGGWASKSGANQFAIAGYDSTGTSLDAGFGTNGIVQTDVVNTAGDWSQIYALALDGTKIVAVGQALDPSGPVYAAAVMRYAADGTADASFDSGFPGFYPMGSANVSGAGAALVQADHKIVIGGFANTSSGSREFALRRIDENGSTDTSFGTGDETQTCIGSRATIHGLALGSDGLYAAGFADDDVTEQFALARYTTDGLLDTSFHGGTVVSAPAGPSHFAQANGLVLDGAKPVLAGAVDPGGDAQFALERFTGGSGAGTAAGCGSGSLSGTPAGGGSTGSAGGTQPPAQQPARNTPPQQQPQVLPPPLVAPVNTVRPFVAGSARPIVGDRFVGVAGQWSGTPAIGYTYTWWRCRVPADFAAGRCAVAQSGSSPFYVLRRADNRHRMMLQVTAGNVAGSAKATAAGLTARVTAPVKPRNRRRPYVRGESTPRVGQLFIGVAGTWAGTRPIDYTYRWLRCRRARDYPRHCRVAQSSRYDGYTLRRQDVGSLMLLVVLAHNAGGTTTVTAPSFTGRIRRALQPPRNRRRPFVKGPSQPEVGQTFTGVAGTWRGSRPIDYLYRWLRCAQPRDYPKHCQLAQSSGDPGYTLKAPDADHLMLLEVTAHNAAGERTVSAPSFTGRIRSAPAPQAKVGRGDLFLIVRSATSDVHASLAASDWTLPVTYSLNELAVQVIDRAGRLVSHARVEMGGSSVGYWDVTNETDAAGETHFLLGSRQAGLVKLVASATGRNGKTLHGYGVLRVADRRRVDNGTYETTNGETFAFSLAGWDCQVGPKDTRYPHCVTSWSGGPVYRGAAPPPPVGPEFAYAQAAFQAMLAPLANDLSRDPVRAARLTAPAYSAVNRVRETVTDSGTDRQPLYPGQLLLDEDSPPSARTSPYRWQSGHIWVVDGGRVGSISGGVIAGGIDSLLVTGRGIYIGRDGIGRSGSGAVVDAQRSTVRVLPDGTSVLDDGGRVLSAGSDGAIAIAG